jgi:hypothetical protein
MKRLMFILVLLACALSAQVNTGSVSGSVTDPSNAMIAGATVTLTNVDTGVKLTATTTAAGQYLFTPLQRGRYSVDASAPGFKKTERSGLELRVGEKLGVDLALQVGNVSEVLNVTAETPFAHHHLRQHRHHHR